MNRFLSIILFFAFFFQGMRADSVRIDGIYYILNSNYNDSDNTIERTAQVAYYSFYEGDIIIPEHVTYMDGTLYTVTGIKGAFQGCKRLTSVTIPSTVTTIGERSFAGCSLTSITIPNSVTNIGNSAFSACKGLTSITIPNSVTSIGDYAFSGCTGLTSVTIPNSVTSIGDYAFRNCTGLTSVTIPNSVTSIGYYTFSGCTGLTSVNIPNSVTSIGDYAFNDCTGLTSVTIPNSVTSIEERAFYNCTGLTSVNVGDSVNRIGERAFEGCTSMTNLAIGKSVNYIAYSAFRSCKDLTSVTINSDTIVSKPYTSTVNLSSFFGSQVKEYIIGDDVKSVGAYALKGCDSLTSVSIGNSVTDINNYAFQGCIGLTSVIIPNSVTSIGDYTFSDCTGLTSVTIPNSMISIGKSVFSGCTGLTSVIIPNSVTSIGDYTFSGCTGLTSVTIPNSMTSIGNSVFSGCTGLTSVTIPNSVTSIGNSVFSGCTGLTSVTTGYSLTSIEDNAFSDCTNLTNVTINSDSITSRSYTPTYSIPNIFGNQVKEYIIGNDVKSIGDYAFYGCDSLMSVYIGKSVNSIGGKYGRPFDRYAKLTRVTINSDTLVSNLQSIKTNYFGYKFSGCKEFIIGDDVKRIGDYRFHGCNMRSITIGNSVVSIGEQAFCDCRELMSIVIPNSVTNIESRAFQSCTNLRSVIIGNSVKNIEQNAFDYTGIEELFYLSSTPPEGWFVSGKTYVPSLEAYGNGIQMISFEKSEYGYTGIIPNVRWSNNVEGWEATADFSGLAIEQGGYETEIPFTFSNGESTFTVNIPYSYSIVSPRLSVMVQNVTREYGEANPEFQIILSGFIVGDDERAVTSLPVATTPATISSPVGSYPIILSGGASDKYDFEYENCSLTITKATLIAKVQNASRVYGEENPTFVLEYTGLKNGETSPEWVTQPTQQTAATENSDVGQYEIYATGGEAVNYELAEIIPGTLTITKAEQTLTWDQNLSNLNFGLTELKAEASSGLPVTYTLAETTIARVFYSSNKWVLQCRAKGEVTLMAVQEGNQNYNPAQSVVRTVTITGPVSSIGEVSVDGASDNDGNVLGYYNLQGQRIAKLQSGQIVIVHYNDGTSRKVLVR